MKINSQVIFLIAIVGIITAGVVGATLLNNGSMKQVDFDGIKVSVPSDSEFVKTADGYADAKYGITIHIFKNNGDMVNYFKGITGAHVVALKNQPPQSLAFVQGDDTNVAVTNGVEGICIGAKDQSLVTDMSNSVVFSNHQKSVKPNVEIPGIAPPPHLEINNDFNFIQALLVQVNTAEFNAAIFESNITTVINDYNFAADQGTLDQYTSDEFNQNATSDSAVIDNNNQQQQNTSLLDNPQANNMVNQMNSSNSGNAAGNNAPSSSSNNNAPSSSSNGAVPSISSDGQSSSSSPASSSSSSSSSSGGAPASSSSSSSSGSSSSAPTKVSQADIKNTVESGGYTVEKIVDKNSYYLVTAKDPQGQVHKFKYDYSGQRIG